MKETLKFAAVAAFTAVFVTAPVAIGIDGSLVTSAAFADGGTSSGPADTGPNTGPNADTGPSTGPNSDGGGGTPITAKTTTVLQLLTALATEGSGSTGPVDTGAPSQETLY